jgi:hypothetical protein
MKKLLFTLVILALASDTLLFSQAVGISNAAITPDASSLLEIRATDKGVLIPRVALTATNAAGPVTLPATSLLVYNTATAGAGATAVYPGYYYNGGTSAAPNWRRLITGTTSGEGWLTTGNYGTTAASNWIGTNDANDFVTRTNNAERYRILSAGNFLVNRTTALFATDLFEAQGNATFPDAINGYTDQAAGSAVYGQHSHINGWAVVGLNSAAAGAGTGIGVMGISAQTGAGGVWGDGGTATRGVIGITNNANYAGVQAQQINAGGDGLYASNSAAAGAGAGSAIFAYSLQTGASTIIAGLSSLSYFSGAAISAITANTVAGGRGVLAACDNATGIALQGQSTGGTATGVLGIVSGAGADGVSGVAAGATGFGCWGSNSNASGTGVVGSGNNTTASYLAGGSGGSFTGSVYGVAAYKDGALANNTGAGYFMASSTAGVGVAVAYRTGGTNYKVINIGAFGGSVSTDVWGMNGADDRRIMFCPESPEIVFQDHGSGQLVNGRATIHLDPVFSRNIVVNEQHPLRVYIQLEGDCNGVYVTSKTKDGFEVIELKGGASNAAFSWFVSANRADYIHPVTNELISKHEGVRFPLAPEPDISLKKQEKKDGELWQKTSIKKIDGLTLESQTHVKIK